MNGVRNLHSASDSQSPFPGKRSRPSILGIDSWMPSVIQAISPLVERLMRLIEGSLCIPGAEPDVELALREALHNAVVHGNQEDAKRKVHIRCRCGPGNEVSIVVTDQGTGFDFRKILGNRIPSEPASEHGRGIHRMKAYMDDVHFERGGSEVHMRRSLRTTSG
jgi:serine/threonine-protein kinase RsbW